MCVGGEVNLILSELILGQIYQRSWSSSLELGVEETHRWTQGWKEGEFGMYAIVSKAVHNFINILFYIEICHTV